VMAMDHCGVEDNPTVMDCRVKDNLAPSDDGHRSLSGQFVKKNSICSSLSNRLFYLASVRS
jgi:hypothetical protein